MKKLAYILIFIGLIVFSYSLTLEPYKNKSEFDSKYNKISGKNRSEQFFELRNKYLTLKYPLADYGLAILIIGILLLFIFFRGIKKFKTLKSKTLIIVFSFLTPFITVMCSLGDLITEQFRESQPHWADSIGIPLMGLPPIFIILTGWSILNLIGLIGDFQTFVPIYRFSFKKINYWYFILCIITLIFLIIITIEGNFWMIIPAFLWLYLYVCLLYGRQNVTQKNTL